MMGLLALGRGAQPQYEVSEEQARLLDRIEQGRRR